MEYEAEMYVCSYMSQKGTYFALKFKLKKRYWYFNLYLREHQASKKYTKQRGISHTWFRGFFAAGRPLDLPLHLGEIQQLGEGGTRWFEIGNGDGSSYDGTSCRAHSVCFAAAMAAFASLLYYDLDGSEGR